MQSFTMRGGDVEVEVMEYGAIILALRTPDRRGDLGDVVLGFDRLEEYLEGSPYFGAVVGRCANRIARGRFALDGTEYQLPCNDGVNHLHGGLRGFDKVLWRGEPVSDDNMGGVALTYVSPDGEEGYPGRLSVRVTYLLSPDGALHVRYHATTDQPTIVNLTQHSYFNMSAGAMDVLGHELMLNAGTYTPIDDRLIPTGECRAVQGTPFDFRLPALIGARIAEADRQLSVAGGYDHNFVLEQPSEGEPVLAARVVDPLSRRAMEIHTTQPGIQLYSGNFLDGSIIGKAGRQYEHRAGFCLETQHFPDSPNHADFPSVVLRPGDEFRSETVYSFGTE